MAEQESREIYSLLVPLAEGRMLLPRASVAEVVGYLKPEPMEDGPAWILGRVSWNQQEIPLVSFEGAAGMGVPEHSSRDRVIVLFGISGRLKPAYYAMLTQGHPHLVRVNQGVISRDHEAEESSDAILARVQMANERPVIPDIEALEHMLGDALGLPGAPEEDESIAGGDDYPEVEGIELSGEEGPSVVEDVEGLEVQDEETMVGFGGHDEATMVNLGAEDEPTIVSPQDVPPDGSEPGSVDEDQASQEDEGDETPTEDPVVTSGDDLSVGEEFGEAPEPRVDVDEEADPPADEEAEVSAEEEAEPSAEEEASEEGSEDR